MKTILLFLAVLLLPSVVSATDYYVRTNGDDNLDGLSDATAWKTISEVNSRSFQPGDTIHFKAGDVWREEMIVSWSGTEGNPITFTRYGSGPNPKISSGEDVSDWVQESAHIYSFSTEDADPNWINPKGAIDANGNLMSKYHPYYRENSSYSAPSSVSNPNIDQLEANMLDGFSWSPDNQGKIFIRSNSGNPGTVIVGKRRNSIYIHGHSHITIDSIDFEGPDGPITNGTDEKYFSALIMVYGEDSTHITVRNCTLKNNVGVAVQFRGGASYSVAEDNVIENCWGGVHGYGVTNYVTIRNNVMKNIGAQIVSGGDRAPISTWGHHWLIEDNYIENTGWPGQSSEPNQIMDCAIVACCGNLYEPHTESGDHIIRRNYMKNIGYGGVMTWDGDRNQVYSNIIDGYMLYPPREDGGGQGRAGINIATYDGARHPVLEDIAIFNNVITGGKDTSYWRDSAIKLGGQNINLMVKNNIVFENEPGISALRAWFPPGSSGYEIENNMFHVPSGRTVCWNNDANCYDLDHVVSPTGCPNPGYWQCDYAVNSAGTVSGNLAGDPVFVDALNKNFRLSEGSPAIDAGASVSTTTDFEGKPIPIDGDDDGTAEFDIGAIEYQPGGCTEDWTCTDWSCSSCQDGQQDCTRTCTDQESCGTEYDKPHEFETRACGTGELVGWWTMDSQDISGGQVLDKSGFGNDGTIYSATHVTGRVGEALYFDGLDDYIDCGNDTSLDTNEMTVLAWIKPLSVGEGPPNAGPLTKAGVVLYPDWSWQIRYNAPGGGDYMGFQVNGQTEGSTWTSVGQSLVPGTWYHIAAMYNGSHISMYLDGQETGSEPLSDMKPSASSFLIGNDGWDNIFNGTIDEVMIWDRALTSQEILDIYDSSFHKADISPKDGCIEEHELIPFIDLWKYDSTVNPMGEVMEAVTLWSRGTGC